MQKTNYNIKNSPFLNFTCSRYSISARINAKSTYDYCKKNNLSFFIVSLACLIKGVNSVPNLHKTIINNEEKEFNKIDGITPLLDEDMNMFEMRFPSPNENESLKEWYNKIVNLRDKILNKEKESFSVAMEKRDEEGIANFSCIPWIDFDNITPAICKPHQIQPLITWGKIREDGEMSVAIAVNHIFVYGHDLGIFYKNIQNYFNNPEF